MTVRKLSRIIYLIFVKNPCYNVLSGRVSEWSNELVSKTSVPHGTAGSNPVPSAKLRRSNEILYALWKAVVG